jgi:hypothetical protein
MFKIFFIDFIVSIVQLFSKTKFGFVLQFALIVRFFGSDIRLNLQATQYGDILDVDFVGPLQTTTIAEKCTLRMVEQFNYLRVNGNRPLATFLDYITFIFFV